MQVTLAMLAIALIARLVWGYHFSRPLAKQIAAIHARGEPISLAEIVVPDMAESIDAWPLVSQAATSAAAVTDWSPRNSNMTYATYPPYSKRWMRMCRKSEAANATAFDLMAQAMNRREARVTLTTGGVVPSFNGYRTLANSLADSAEFAHVEARDADAFNRLAMVARLADLMRQAPSVLTVLVGAGIDDLANSSYERIAPGLSNSAKQAVSRDAIHQAIVRLLDDDSVFAAAKNAFHFEEAEAIDQYRGGQRVAVWCVHPLLERKLGQQLTYDFVSESAAGARTNPEMISRLDHDFPAWRTADAVVRAKLPPRPVDQFVDWFNEGNNRFIYARYLEVSFRLVAERHVAAISLAANLYRLDHGAFPDRLERLTPGYLPTVPSNPFSSDGRAIEMVMERHANGSPRPMLFFGAEAPSALDTSAISPNPIYGWKYVRAHDLSVRQYRDLTSFTPPQPTSLPAADDDAEQSDQPDK